MKISLSELDVIFISYDEPNADENWADLQNKCPWAKRSHGVYGSDSAHKAAAELSETPRFIGIDADNIINPEIFNLEFEENIINSERVLSWAGYNIVNGLVYGNGGIKSWPVNTVMEMRTHENSDEQDVKNVVEFCWQLNYLQQEGSYCDVYNNASPYQAFRAGFREGVKMGLNEGAKIPKEQFLEKIYPANLKRLLIWMSLGSDSENGMWCIYGARLGCYLTNCTDWDFVNVRDFEYITQYWEEEIAHQFLGDTMVCPRTNYSWSSKKLYDETIRLGNVLDEELHLKIADLNPQQSKFVKGVL